MDRKKPFQNFKHSLGHFTFRQEWFDFKQSQLEKLETVRENTLKEFAKKDDDWLLKVDQKWCWGPTNNYCKWFHVCEHESTHNGQFKFIKSRLPSAQK
jgi:hypothetical protein